MSHLLTAVAGRSIADDAALAILQRFGTDRDVERLTRQIDGDRALVEREAPQAEKQTTAIAGDWLARYEPVPAGYRAARSHGREAFSISLPHAAGEARKAGRRALPVLLDADTRRQVGVAEIQQDDTALVRFSTSREGARSQADFAQSKVAVEVAYLSQGNARAVPAALTLRTVSSDSLPKETLMSDNYQLIADLGERHGKRDMALKAIAAGHTIEQFRSDLLDQIGDKPITSFYNQNTERTFSLSRLILAEATSDWSNAGYEREMSQEAKRNYPGQAKGLVIPSEALFQRTTMSSSGDAAGAIGTDHMGSMYVDALRPVSSVIAAGATMLSGLSSNVSIPKANSDLSAAWVAEGGAITESDIDVDSVTLQPKLLAGRSSFTRHLLATSNPSIDSLVRNALVAQIGNALDDTALEGSGTAPVPRGIANQVGIETYATTGGGTMTHAESLAVLAEIAENNLDTTNAVWIVNPANAATLGSTAKDSGSGQFVYQDGRILGRRVIESTHATAGTAYVGLFEHCLIGMFGGIDLVVDPYTNGSTGVVNIYAYQLADIAVRHPGAFSKVTLTA
jgi:HK97 family phage major capsid protein